ncbi:ATP-binding protein [Kitasatospora sp. GP82]|uniref:sensor histidine kinase n=1 Tax=Kitasatospora sp. GP82 TaxID=3035089 RepID=UPI0024749138|nr:ATP-binding protein [Kitasatospora sp. GP82]MDH6125586.1 anti-sigma regulatory factor (Ser/Thr protein kinase) [Kitasatospora sp. GP82]
MRVRRGSTRSAPAATTPSSAARGPVRPGGTGQRRGAHAGPPAREAVPVPLPPPPQPGPAVRAPRLRLRPRTVRARIVALLMVPVVSVMALWSFATVTTAQNVWDLLSLQQVHRTLLGPVDATITGLQAERSAAGQLLAAPGAARESTLRDATAATDRAVAPLNLGEHYNSADAQGLGTEAAARVDALGAAVTSLGQLRSRVLTRSVGWAETYAAYTAAIDRAFDVTGAVTQLQDHQAASDARVLMEFARSRELLAREDSLLRSGQTAGSLTDQQLREFDAAVYARRLFAQSAGGDLRTADRSALAAITSGTSGSSGTDYRDLTRYEDAVRTASGGQGALAAVSADQWAVASDNVARALMAVETTAGSAAAERVDPYALGLFTPSGAAVLLGLGAVVASLLISVQIGRGLVTELIGLRNSALELAGRKLPATMRRLRAGQEIDIEAEAPLRPHGEDEIGQVHGALGTVQRAAVTAAVERAEVLSGVSGVFVNLARRSQVLVHRQLTLLDAMERRTEDPAELEDLFRLDHLTTRMRRHAEGLIILSGAVPGRAWRKPVPLMDVVRAAVAEVEEYARVEVHRLPHAALTGPAVADLTHLIAELVENATGFSPPHTKVHIRGEQVGNGYALEIEDRGLGMGPEALADANRRIAAAEEVDLFDSDRLGLFVVSRLAKRQRVGVALRPSAYGGTTAVVLLPNALLEAHPERAPEPEDLSSLLDDAGSAQTHTRTQLHTQVRTPAPPPPPAAPPVAPLPAPPTAPPSVAPAAARGPLPPGAVEPFGASGNHPGVLRPTPFSADGSRPPRLPVVRPLGAGQAPPAQRPRPAQAPGAPGPRTVGAAPAAIGDELPRRVRQASLAPQLREAPPRPQPGARPRGPVAAGRNPEEARAAMSAYQQGWARGKSQRPQRPGATGGPSASPTGSASSSPSGSTNAEGRH